MQIGIVAALADEANTLAFDVNDDQPIIEISGAGPRPARKAAQMLLDRGVTHLVSWGTAAGLDATLQAGSLVIYSETTLPTGDRRATTPAWTNAIVQCLSSLQPTLGAGYTADHPVASSAAKQRLFAETNCIALDMESGVIAECADIARVPFAAVRAIVDNAATDLPDSAVRALGEDGQINVTALMGTLIKRPADIPGLIRLGRSYRRALGALRHAAVLLTPSFSLGNVPPQN